MLNIYGLINMPRKKELPIDLLSFLHENIKFTEGCYLREISLAENILSDLRRTSVDQHGKPAFPLNITISFHFNEISNSHQNIQLMKLSNSLSKALLKNINIQTNEIGMNDKKWLAACEGFFLRLAEEFGESESLTSFIADCKRFLDPIPLFQ